ncbi:hypothetical protein RFI_17784 [Reticulomyxa filosa]|uniref:Muniscin C-terminal domain-containing protein n=1 Tax=Reticulomyxa filosa TaxID=46433 RepID=X6N0N5_RETFI|nr:hypothetical protein RFI_17784 [Reticulomyxa filosa]|eukprot:ETO19448.1 hypothetical protein RFI_17784 [Reticulomyxa filosa]
MYVGHEKGDCIQVKYPANEQEIPLLKYSWDVENPLSVCPVMMKIVKKFDESHALLHCKLRLNPKYSSVNVSEFSIKAKCQPDGSVMERCSEHLPAENDTQCQFHWSKEHPHTFMWKINGFAGTKKEDKSEQFELKANFDTSKLINDFDVKCSFCIEDFGVSKISLAEPDYKQKTILQGINHARTVRSGDFVIR